MRDYEFGNFLYTLRSEKGFSQAQLGEMLGVTNKAVSKWENGTTKPNTDLIPQIAKIFDVTVEELFACKKIEKGGEYEKIKTALLIQKRKYAILSSVFLSAITTIPLFLIYFIFVMAGFDLPDSVAGPLGAVGFIIAFIVSVTAYVIYRKNFKQAITPTEQIYPSRFVNLIKRGTLLSAILFGCLLLLMLPIFVLILTFSSRRISATIFLVVAFFFLVLLLGVFICFWSIKLQLKIKFSQSPRAERKQTRFSELPLWVKTCMVAYIMLFPLVLIIQFFCHHDWLLLKIVSLVALFGCEFAIIFYALKQK